MPDQTNAAPPLDPPGTCARFHGLLVRPKATGSVIGATRSCGSLSAAMVPVIVICPGALPEICSAVG